MRKFKTVLVTGGAGFIGSNYLNRLVPKHPDVHFINFDALTYAGNLQNLTSIANKPNYSFEKGDVTDESRVRGVLETHDVDVVVHFAAESHVDRSISDPGNFVRTNVDGTLVLLHEANRFWTQRRKMGFFHHVSTDEVFGSLGAKGHFTPTSPYAPRSPYAASKAAADHLVRAFGTTYGLPYVITNTSNNYGPYQFPEKLIPLVIKNTVAGNAIPVYGKGDNVRDWLHVEDHCEALEKVLFHGKESATYLIGGSEESSNLELVTTLLDMVDTVLKQPIGKSRQLITFVKDRAGHDFRYAIDSSETQQALNWKPKHTLQTGLLETVQWYLSHEDWLRDVVDESYLSYYQRQYVDRESNQSRTA